MQPYHHVSVHVRDNVYVWSVCIVCVYGVYVWSVRMFCMYVPYVWSVNSQHNKNTRKYDDDVSKWDFVTCPHNPKVKCRKFISSERWAMNDCKWLLEPSAHDRLYVREGAKTSCCNVDPQDNIVPGVSEENA